MQQQMQRTGFTIGLISLGLLVGAALTAGPAQAGSVGPYYATPSWDQTLPAPTRFIILSNFNNEAVLDRNTGLVWEQAPDATPRVWQNFGPPAGATNYCVNKNVGGTKGWRLPSVAELASMIDPSLPAPFVPGTVFTGVQSALYWSASTYANVPTGAWFVNFNVGFVGANEKSFTFLAWCVRGGMNADAY